MKKRSAKKENILELKTGSNEGLATSVSSENTEMKTEGNILSCLK